MNAYYAEICRVVITWRQIFIVLLIQFFLKFSQYHCETPVIQIQQWKVKKKIFLNKKKKKSV